LKAVGKINPYRKQSGISKRGEVNIGGFFARCEVIVSINYFEAVSHSLSRMGYTLPLPHLARLEHRFARDESIEGGSQSIDVRPKVQVSVDASRLLRSNVMKVRPQSRSCQFVVGLIVVFISESLLEYQIFFGFLRDIFRGIFRNFATLTKPKVWWFWTLLVKWKEGRST